MLQKYRLAPDAGILLVLIGVTALFELLGWALLGQSFLFNAQRLPIIILQVSIVGIIAVGMTQVIITGGIDLSSGSVAAMAAMIAASFAQKASGTMMYFDGIADLPVIIPLIIGIAVGCAAGWVNGAITAYTGVPPFIPTLGMLVAARGVAVLYNGGNPIIGLTDSYKALGAGITPVFIFLIVAVLFHIALTRTLYGRWTYAVGSNEGAARISGIDIRRHKVLVYTIAGGLAGLAGVIMSGFTFLRVDFYYQEIAKGFIILAAVTADQYRGQRNGARGR